MGSTLSLDADMGELHTGSRLPLCGTDPESYFYLHIVKLG